MMKCSLAVGADAWLLRMNAVGAPLGPNACLQSLWTDDVTFFNNGSHDAQVRFLDATYALTASGVPIVVGRSVSIREAVGALAAPSLSERIGVLHVDVPPDVAIMSRMILFAQQAEPLPAGCSVLAPPFYGPSAFSTVALPIRTLLSPANARQVHLGADLAGIDSRMSAAIYNATDTSGTAIIELRRGCDDGIIEQRRVIVPGRAVVQVAGFSTADDHGCKQGDPGGLRRTITISVDQPSLSWVTATQLSSQGAPLLGSSVVY